MNGWAEPLSSAERRELAGKLERACRMFGAGSRIAKRRGEHYLAFSLVLAAGDMAVLATDITERTRAAAS